MQSHRQQSHINNGIINPAFDEINVSDLFSFETHIPRPHLIMSNDCHCDLKSSTAYSTTTSNFIALNSHQFPRSARKSNSTEKLNLKSNSTERINSTVKSDSTVKSESTVKSDSTAKSESTTDQSKVTIETNSLEQNENLIETWCDLANERISYFNSPAAVGAVQISPIRYSDKTIKIIRMNELKRKWKKFLLWIIIWIIIVFSFAGILATVAVIIWLETYKEDQNSTFNVTESYTVLPTQSTSDMTTKLVKRWRRVRVN